MASRRTARSRLARTLSAAPAPVSELVLHEDWCVKESGSAFLGKTNWRRRWFRLVQRGGSTALEYLKGRNDRLPAGSVKLDVTYCTRQVESHEKPHPNCFAVGPLIDDGALRTYYISCSSVQGMQEWMTVIDAAIQGVPEQAQRRRQTISQQFNIRRASRGKAPPTRAESVIEDDSVEAALDICTPKTSSGSLGLAVVPGVQREELSDDELWENVEDEVSGGEDEEALTSQSQTYHTPDAELKPAARLRLYDSHSWRLEHWQKLCEAAENNRWAKVDTKDGVTISRCKFGRDSGGHAVIKVQGTLPAEPATVHEFMRLSTQEGGKLDYMFRNETLLQVIADDPIGEVVFNQFLLPLPRVSQRDVVTLKAWIPAYLSPDSSSGLVMFSVDHPSAPQPDKESRRIHIRPSGIILRPTPGPGGVVHTSMTILVQLALYGALHRMLKGAYNSGLLKLGIRSTFMHIAEQLDKFVLITC